MRQAWNSLNGTGKLVICGGVLVGLAVLFTVMNAAPWANKESVRTTSAAIDQRVADLKDRIDTMQLEQARQSAIVYGVAGGLQTIHAELAAINRRLDRIETRLETR